MLLQMKKMLMQSQLLDGEYAFSEVYKAGRSLSRVMEVVPLVYIKNDVDVLILIAE